MQNRKIKGQVKRYKKGTMFYRPTLIVSTLQCKEKQRNTW